MQPFLHVGGRDRQTATASLYDLRLKRDAVNAANMDVPLAFGTERESVRGMRCSGHPKPGIIQNFRSFNASDRPRLRDAQCFGSFKILGRPRLLTTQGFGSPKASDHPRLQIAQISGFQASLMKKRKKKKGGIAPFRPSNSTPMTKNRCLENPEHHFCCIHNETALNQASFRCNNNLCTGKIPL